MERAIQYCSDYHKEPTGRSRRRKGKGSREDKEKTSIELEPGVGGADQIMDGLEAGDIDKMPLLDLKH